MHLLYLIKAKVSKAKQCDLGVEKCLCIIIHNYHIMRISYHIIMMAALYHIHASSKLPL